MLKFLVFSVVCRFPEIVAPSVFFGVDDVNYGKANGTHFVTSQC